MNNCEFCEIVKNKTLELCQGAILYEDDLLIIFPARGGIVPGYLMIILKKHYNGFAELNENEMEHVIKIIKEIKVMYKNHYGIDSILLEHGSTEKGRHPTSIVHAHIHLIPFNFIKEIENELINNLKLNDIDDFKQLKKNAKKDYWMYCNPNGKYMSSVEVLDPPRSIFMNLMAKQLGIKMPYEWRKEPTRKENVEEMIELFKNFKI